MKWQCHYNKRKQNKHIVMNSYWETYSCETIELKSSVQVYNHLFLGNEKFCSIRYGGGTRHGNVHAHWCGANTEVDFDADLRPCKIRYFFQHSVNIGNGFSPHVFAAVNWSKRYPGQHSFMDPITVWKEKNFELPGSASFIPVQRLHSKFAKAAIGSNQLVVSPIPAKVYV